MYQTLQQHLAAIAEQRATIRTDIEAILAKIKTEQQQARAEIARLEQWLGALNAQARDQQEAFGTQISTLDRDEIATVLAALEKSYVGLLKMAPNWSQWITLREQRQALEAAYPQLQEELNAYQRFEEKGRALVIDLPDLYRVHVLAEHENLSQRLAPFLAITAQEQALKTSEAVEVQLVLVHDTDGGGFFCVVPLPASVQMIPEDARRALETVGEAILTAIGTIRLSNEWFVAELSTEQWAAYTVLHVLAEYQGTTPISHTMQALANTYLRHPNFAHFALDIQVTEMTLDAWRKEQSTTSEVTSPVKSESFQHALPPNNWYVEADIHSWERTVKVGEGSQWNTQARRLRTVLMRLIAHGSVGTNPVDGHTLWDCLPIVHQDAMRKGLERLLEARVLMPVDTIQPQYVVINPEHLADVQLLINRDVPDSWVSSIIAE